MGFDAAPSANMARRFAILLSGHASEYIRGAYGGVACLFKEMLSDPDETWDTFPVVDGVFPSDDELGKYHCFIVTGSRHDAHGSEDWVLKLCELIQKVHRMKKKLLGVCFGHQIICRALGGKTGRADNGWEIGLKKVVRVDSSYAKLCSVKLPSSLSIIKFHQDEVWELPPGGEIIAMSEKTKIEMFAVADHVLGIQGHPEFTEDIVMDLLDLCSKQNLIQDEVINRARSSFESGRADRTILKQLCKSFIKGTAYELDRFKYESFQGALEPCTMACHTMDLSSSHQWIGSSRAYM